MKSSVGVVNFDLGRLTDKSVKAVGILGKLLSHKLAGLVLDKLTRKLGV